MREMLKSREEGKISAAFSWSGGVRVYVNPEYEGYGVELGVSLTPDEARLLGLKLIRVADIAESEDN
jgi:hypothetical protein